jgi:bifunctional UDP-N-acetylglucosamine pyrophosphorylase/glucosamine-1-phosphate N-acetyltransferase
MKTTAVILAAGRGKRMRSSLPKVLHPLLGKPMVQYSLDAVGPASNQTPVLVVGHQAEVVKKAVDDQARYVYQAEQLGTGHAVQQAEKLLEGETDLILVINADMPLVRAKTLQKLVKTQKKHAGPFSLLTLTVDDPRGFGRIIRDEQGNVVAIVEEREATPEQRAIRELNAAMYCFSADWLWDALGEIELSPKGEYYLTDLVSIATARGERVKAVQVEDPAELMGINTRVHLTEAVESLKRRINNHWLRSGVTIMDPHTTYIEPGVKIGKDTMILPNTHIQGETKIGKRCLLGPNSLIRSSTIGNDCEVEASVVEDAVLEDHVDIGPFGHLRKGAHLAEGVHMGNFGEIKQSYLGKGTKVGHFSYLGDATLGEDVNVGAGTITCNYDGEQKHPTEIGDQVFLGSDTMLIAPIKIGKRARTGAGAVVNKDIPAETLVVGVPARAIKSLSKENPNGEDQ